MKDDGDDDDDAIAALVRWSVTNGARARGVCATRDERRGRGLETTRVVAKHEVVLAVPMTLGIVDEAEGHPVKTREVVRGAPWGARLAMRVMQERAKGSGSRVAAYVATLPRRVATSPLAYDDDEVDDVQYGPGVSEIRAMREGVRKWYEKVKAEAPEALGEGDVGYSAFADAVSVVHSRAYGIAGDNENDGETVGYFRALLPLADMMNHGGDVVLDGSEDSEPRIAATDNIAWSVLGDDGVISFAATRDIDEGEEALMSYGERSNDHFLIYYGFAPENNPHDDVVLFSNFEHAMVWHSVAHPELWNGEDGVVRERAANAAYESVIAALRSDGSPDAKLAAAEPRMKILSAGRVDARLLSAFAAMFAGTEASGAADGPVEGDELKFALADVAARCEQLLGGMPTTLADDFATLAAGVDDDAQRVRLQYRISKKKILAETIEMFSL